MKYMVHTTQFFFKKINLETAFSLSKNEGSFFKKIKNNQVWNMEKIKNMEAEFPGKLRNFEPGFGGNWKNIEAEIISMFL